MSLPPPSKRRRVSGSISPLAPLTPEESVEGREDDRSGSANLLERATHVLRVEARALLHVTSLYETDATARDGLTAAVNVILDAHHHGCKTIVCGVGKSAYIAQKLVATMKSLSVGASFMHACEAAHGDLGDIRAKDVVLFVSFSGKTPELMNILPHIPASVRILALTAHLDAASCPLLVGREGSVLIPAPIPEKEETSFGVCAPTTSTTVALAISDMLALTIADELHREKTNLVFKGNHPGGAIGITHREMEVLKESKCAVTVVELPSPSISAESED